MTRTRLSTILAITILLAPGLAAAQQRDGNFLDNLFTRGESGGQQRAAPPPAGRAVAQSDDDASVRIDRIEAALRQMTGQIEQLQYQNQQLQMQLQRLLPQGGVGVQGGAMPAAPAGPPPAANVPGRRSDAFDPNQQPNAPGAPRTLGNQTASAAPNTAMPNATIMNNEPPVGAPGGRDAGAPLDLSSVSGTPMPPAGAQPPTSQQAGQPPRMAQPNTRLATLPPSARPQDEYDLAYGYVLHKDYGLAEQAFGDFLRKYPDEHLVPDAQYWLGESQFQQQRYSEAAKSFLVVITKHERAGKAPDSLLRLGQSLAALKKKEAACATLAEVGRKYPKASASVKRSVEQEQKRVHC